MALITPGPMAGQISGRLGSVIYSHNRGGPYCRNGTIPTLVTSQWAIDAKARLSAQSQAWDNLDINQRRAWLEWARSNPVTNRLGSQVTIGGNAAFVGINTRLDFCDDATLTDPPIADPPTPLTSLALTADIGAGDVEIAFAPTPLGEDERLLMWAVVLNNPAVTYVENLLRLLPAKAKATTSPQTIKGALIVRFGTLAVGQKIVLRCTVIDSTNGLVSAPIQDEAIIVST